MRWLYCISCVHIMDIYRGAPTAKNVLRRLFFANPICYLIICGYLPFGSHPLIYEKHGFDHQVGVDKPLIYQIRVYSTVLSKWNFEYTLQFTFSLTIYSEKTSFLYFAILKYTRISILTVPLYKMMSFHYFKK